MSIWQKYRQIILVSAFAGVFLTLGRFSLDSTVGNRPLKHFAFPSVVPLPGWQLLESSRIASPDLPVVARQKYRYEQNNQQIEIEMRYLVNTYGELRDYFQAHSAVQLQDAQLLQNLRQHKGIGFYSLFVYQGRSHLSACINSRGGGTVTGAQFLANRHAYDLQPQFLVPWLLGKESLRDTRCLWADLSTPINQVSAESTYPVLEKAWWSWYQWWSSRFPKVG